jgi:hypothetical protein
MNRKRQPDGAMLARIMRSPPDYAGLDLQQWSGILSVARAELMLGALAHRLAGLDLPPAVAAVMADARLDADYQRRSALWEADCARRALDDYSGKAVLMKGTAYVAAGLAAGVGRHIGDLDIMVARDDLADAERMLMEKGGWEWVKEDAYDDAYYRDHMHELPPMIHRTRDRMIDVHHTILPLTAKPIPDAAAMLAEATVLKNGLYVFSNEDMVCHCAAHVMADGDLTGGMRNLWDMHGLLSEFSSDEFWSMLKLRAHHHQLWPAVSRAARLAQQLYGTAVPEGWAKRNWLDSFYIRRIVARDAWGRGTAKTARALFYMRSHILRMPPLMLAKHLWVKWRKR